MMKHFEFYQQLRIPPLNFFFNITAAAKTKLNKTCFFLTKGKIIKLMICNINLRDRLITQDTFMRRNISLKGSRCDSFLVLPALTVL